MSSQSPALESSIQDPCKTFFLHFEFLIAQQVWLLASRCLLIRWLSPQGALKVLLSITRTWPFQVWPQNLDCLGSHRGFFSMSFPSSEISIDVSITARFPLQVKYPKILHDIRHSRTPDVQLSTCNVSLTGLLSDDRGLGTSKDASRTLRVLVFCGPNGPTLSTANKSVTEILSLLFWILTFQSCSVMFRYWTVLLWDHSAKELKEFSTKAWAVTTICHSLNGSMKHHELMEER